jgi:hypothetical protein
MATFDKNFVEVQCGSFEEFAKTEESEGRTYKIYKDDESYYCIRTPTDEDQTLDLLHRKAKAGESDGYLVWERGKSIPVPVKVT